jgi:hypothetical protein
MLTGWSRNPEEAYLYSNRVSEAGLDAEATFNSSYGIEVETGKYRAVRVMTGMLLTEGPPCGTESSCPCLPFVRVCEPVESQCH